MNWKFEGIPLVAPPDRVASGIDGGGGGTRRWVLTLTPDFFVWAAGVALTLAGGGDTFAVGPGFAPAASLIGADFTA